METEANSCCILWFLVVYSSYYGMVLEWTTRGHKRPEESCPKRHLFLRQLKVYYLNKTNNLANVMKQLMVMKNTSNAYISPQKCLNFHKKHSGSLVVPREALRPEGA